MKKSIKEYFTSGSSSSTVSVNCSPKTIPKITATKEKEEKNIVLLATKTKKIRSDVNDVVKDVEVVAVDVQGIMYYVDKYDNVYEMEDVLGNKQNPKIISTLPQQLMYV